MSALSAGHTKTLLHLCPHKTTVIHKLYHAVHEAGLKFMKWCLYGVHDGEIGLAPVLFSSVAWLQLSEYVNFHNYIFPVLIYKLPFHVFKILYGML